jgi:hypothetical protein
MTSRNLHRLGLLYAAIPILTSVYNGYEVATAHLDQKHAIDWLGIFAPRLSLAIILAFIVYSLVRAADAFLARLHGIALAAQPTWRFITSSRHERTA